MPTYPVELIWCSNQCRGRGNGWSFPPNVRRQIEQDTEGQTVCHLFGGRSSFGTRLDLDPIVQPDVIGDAWLPPFAQDSFDTVVLDPPYFHLNSQAKNSLFRASAWIARRRVIWFSTFWVASGAGLAVERAWLIRVGDSCQVRCLQYFTVRRPKTPPVRYFSRGPAMKYNRWLAQPEALPL